MTDTTTPSGLAANVATPYGTLPPSSPPPQRRPVSLPRLQQMREAGEKITMLTCYDATFAAVLDAAREVADAAAALRSLNLETKTETTTMESAIIHNQPSPVMATPFDKTVVNPVTAPDPTESTIVMPKPPAQG